MSYLCQGQAVLRERVDWSYQIVHRTFKSTQTYLVAYFISLHFLIFLYNLVHKIKNE